MSRALPDTAEGLRDRAALTVGFYLAARASDLAWLKVGDIVEERKGLVVTVREGKTTGQSGLQARDHPLLCPREAWLRWREAADLDDGPALRRARGSRVGDAKLSPDAVIRLLRRTGEAAGLPYRVTGHGLRRGFVTAAYDGGKGWDPLRSRDTAGGPTTRSREFGGATLAGRTRRGAGTGPAADSTSSRPRRTSPAADPPGPILRFRCAGRIAPRRARHDRGPPRGARLVLVATGATADRGQVI